jgi:hypothetical protein
MLGVRSLSLAIGALLFCTLVALRPSAATAQSIDLSLNVIYASPGNVNSGGTWELVGKATGANFGISAVNAKLKGVSAPANHAPRGTVNGDDPAGFGIFVTDLFPTLIIAQQALDLGLGEEQGAFYGVGKFANGSPDFAGRQAGTTIQAGAPTLASLTNPADVPWATTNTFGDPAWATAARLATGTFALNAHPSFDPGSTGNVFTTTGNSLTFGTNVTVPVTTIVRTNFAPNADYNHNGVVDAADYVLWRNANGTSVFPGAAPDGNGDGFVNTLDYDFWRSRFGLAGGAGSGGSVSSGEVPEPASCLLVLIAALAFSLSFVRFPRRGLAPFAGDWLHLRSPRSKWCLSPSAR